MVKVWFLLYVVFGLLILGEVEFVVINGDWLFVMGEV